MTSTPPPSDLLRKARALVDAVTFDNHGAVVGGQFMGGHGGLISRETIKAADDLRKTLLAWEAAQ